MRKISFLVVTVLALTVALSAAPKAKRQTVQLFMQTQVAGSDLKPGEYQVAVEGTTATFFRNGKEVAKTEVRSEDVGQKYATNSMVYSENGKSLLEIRLEGSKTKLVVEGGAVNTR